MPNESEIVERAWRAVVRVMGPSTAEPGQPDPAYDAKAEFAVNMICGILPVAMRPFTCDFKPVKHLRYRPHQVAQLLGLLTKDLGAQFNDTVERLTDGLVVLSLALYESQGLLGMERSSAALREALLRSGARGREEAEEAEFRGYLS
jgi:hypothetical protein